MGAEPGGGGPDLFDLSGRPAVVTGGASGLGRSIAVGLARFGASVTIGDIDLEGARATADLARAEGGQALAVACDVSDPVQVERLFATAAAEHGPVRILVNDAFRPPHREHPERFPLERWQEGLEVSLTGYFLCAREAGRRMIEAGLGGSIVNISSIAGTSALGRGNFVYSVAKHGIEGLTRELAIEWARWGIRVNAIRPCQFETPGLQPLLRDPGDAARAMVERFRQGIPLGRLGQPDEMVGPVVFLASDASSMVTGVMLPVDGGNLAMNAGASLSW
jgi:NAD(P)-dependent dehydrogenase (short-subunit alcohol dehydrogenase family)